MSNRRYRLAGFTLIELMIVVVILAILAVVAVPSFVRFMRRAKTSEAVTMLEKVVKGAALYYTTPHVANTSGARIPCQFPGKQAVTPIEGTCCSSNGLGGPDADADDRCDADPVLWSSTSWRALSFDLRDNHFYVYAFESAGVLSDAGFTASAHGDLDCDAVQSTFQRHGFGDPAASNTECSMRTGPAIYIEHETE